MMNNKLINGLAIIFGILGLVLIVFVARLGISIIDYIIVGFQALEPKVYIPLFVTLTTAIIALGVALYTQARIRKRAIEEAHREKKVAMYYDFLKMFQNIQQSIKPEFNVAPIDEIELAKRMMDFQTDIALWASPKVLLTFSNFLSISKKGGGGFDAMFAIDAVYRAMRSDIGLSNKGLKKDHFIKSMLTDPNDLDNTRN